MDSKVLNFTEYLQAHKYKNKTAQKISAMVIHFIPKIEQLFEDEILKMSMTEEIYDNLKNDSELRDNLDLTVITSLCYLLAQYLITLSQRENMFNVTEAHVEKFSLNIMKGMLRTFEIQNKEDTNE